MGEKPGRARARKEDAWQGMPLHTTMKVSSSRSSSLLDVSRSF